MDWYNGFSPAQRARRGTARARRTAPAHATEPPCAMCGDPSPAKVWSHAESYAEPYDWSPPASFPVCDPCHRRLHGRFLYRDAWRSYRAFLRQGWYGREVTTADLRRHRFQGDGYKWPALGHEPPKRAGAHAWWWERLTLDPRSLRNGTDVAAT